MTTISSLTQSALTQLNNLISSTALVQSQGGIPLREWKDELGRLRLWAGNIGAHRTGQSSLDYRLRDASHIRSQTIKILTAIGKLLRELHDTFNEDEVENEPLDEEIQDLVAGMDLADPSDIASTLRNAHERLTNMISQLFDISMTVRKPAQHDRLLGTARADGEPFKFHFRQHLSHKFPQSEIYLIDRISSAMAQQRAILKYRERHHLKLSQGLGLHDACDNDTVKLSETVASTFIPESLDHDLTSNSDTSFTSYAGSLLSGERLAIPALPKNATDQQPFECPYCFFIITIKNRQSWARHIFRDLSPYICVFARCSTQNRLYDSRKEWYGHIRQRHLTSQDGSLPNASFEKHVGRHLEELALFVLPRETEDDGVQKELETRYTLREWLGPQKGMRLGKCANLSRKHRKEWTGPL
ncbi:hypothetical protein BJY04DRAFT_225686 [Aspergillus karnatakaensis]|uniref:uncharacterized protein n=1 Tax=Aspergillus karnatakaensis TaxID=1810916 RepID=UPI003CCDCAE2